MRGGCGTGQHVAFRKFFVFLILAFLLSGVAFLVVQKVAGVTVLRCQTCQSNCPCPVLLGGPRCSCAR